MLNKALLRISKRFSLQPVDIHDAPLRLFTYEPLPNPKQHIRILKIAPAEKPSPVECQLITADTLAPSTYDALSYTWGPPDTLDLWVMIDRKRFLVRENLWHALVSLRSTSQERYLWVDAICINQDDFGERNAQVRMMNIIFAQAQCVYAWLGVALEHSDTAIDLLHSLSPSLWNHSEKRIYFQTEQAAGAFQALQKLLKRDYWHRVWIVQEIATANDIVICCGTGRVSWKKLDECHFQVHSYLSQSHKFPEFHPKVKEACDELVTSNAMRLVELRKTAETHETGPRFSADKLFGISQQSFCADPHDKVYGVLGIVHVEENKPSHPSSSNSKMPIDYGKSLFEVYSDMVQYRILENYAECWNVTRRHFFPVSFARCVQLLLGGPFPVTVDELVPSVKVHALVGGVISAMGPKFHGASLENARVTVIALRGNCTDMEAKYLQSRLRQVHHMPEMRNITSCSFSATIEDNKSHIRNDYSNAYQKNHIYAERSFSTKTPESVKHPPCQPRFFMGSTGQIGLAPDRVQEGDWLCQFVDSDVVAFLRQDVGKGTFDIIGKGFIVKNLNDTLESTTGFGSIKLKLWGEVPTANLFDLDKYFDITIGLDTLQDLTSTLDS